jgi:hypothetical protein
MDNMQFDEATQTYWGAVGPYRWSEEEHGQPFTAFHKPLRVTPEWVDQSHLDVFAGYWQGQWNNEGGAEIFAVKPWAYMGQTQNQTALTQTADRALQQLIQAMAGFATPAMGQVDMSMGQLFNAFQMWGVDAGA